MIQFDREILAVSAYLDFLRQTDAVMHDFRVAQIPYPPAIRRMLGWEETFVEYMND